MKIIKQISMALVLFAISAAPVSAAMAGTSTWIGGSSGACKDASNWDNGLPHENAFVARVTNSVTFTETGDDNVYWKPTAVKLTDGVVVTNAMCDMPLPEQLPEGQWVFDIGEGALYYNKYTIYGMPDVTLVKKGTGVLQSYWVGRRNSRFRNVDVREGTLYASCSGFGSFRLTPYSNLYVRAGALVKLGYTNCFSTNGAIATVEGSGVIDCMNFAQTFPGLAGDGVVSNGLKGVRLTLERTGCVFGGKIYGKLEINPDLTWASPGSYAVIGAADTLADAALTIEDVEGFPNPLRFAAGIGTFYAKDFPDRKYYDVEGNEVVLKRKISWYVDPSRTEEQGDGDGRTPETAFRTLKGALENPALSEYDMICALPGFYTNGVMGTGSTRARAEVPANVRLESRDGAETTFIVGANATNEVYGCYGCGAGAIRCVGLAVGAKIVGFTLMGGRTYCTSTTSGEKGGGVNCADTSSHVVDCVMSNNVAYRGGAGHRGTYIRCRAYGNRCTQIGAVWNDHCDLYNCVTDGNYGGYSYYVANNPAKIVNCTFGPNDAGSFRASGLSSDNKAHFYNSVFLTAPTSADPSALPDEGSVLHRCLCAKGLDPSYARDDGCIVTNISSAADRLSFAGLGADLRPLSAVSAVVDVGNDVYWNQLPSRRVSLLADLDGDVRIQGRAIDLGAFEYDWHNDAVYISAPDGGLTVTGAALGANSVAIGETLTFNITRAFNSDLLCTGFTTNGVFVSFDDFPDGWTWTVDGDDFSTAVKIAAVYRRSTEWFVDPENGNDSNRGYHLSCPKRTLAEVMTNTAIASGDVVWAAPGWYTNGVMGSAQELSRVSIPEGVMLKSTAGSESTFIVGEPSPNAVTNGCGSGAVRCVFLNDHARISGFTLTNGFTYCTSRTAGKSGGGVCGVGDFPCGDRVVEDCIIRNCTAIRGGGASGAKCVRCRFYANGTPYSGTAASFCELANCLFSGHTTGASMTLNCFNIRNCTFLSDNDVSLASYTTTPNDGTTNICNSVILCAQRQAACYSHCIFSSVPKIQVADADMGEGSRKMHPNEMGLDAEGRPTSRTSVVVDAGNNALYRLMTFDPGDKDFDGNQRNYNGIIDIGCYEFDWRHDFARSLGSSSLVSVTAASPSVTTNANGGLLLLGDGAALDTIWTNSSLNTKGYSFTVQVTGGGMLVVNCDGVAGPFSFTESDGTRTVSCKSATADPRQSFVFSGEGSAVISRFSKCGGMAVILR